MLIRLDSQLPDDVRQCDDDETRREWRSTYGRLLERRRHLDDAELRRRHAERIARTFHPVDDGHECADPGEVGSEALDELPEEGRRLESVMDREESGLSNDLLELARSYRKGFKSRIRDRNVGANQLEQALRRLRDEYRPKFQRVIADRATRIRERAQSITIEENEWLQGLVDKSNLPDPTVETTPTVKNASFEDSMKILVDDLAQEVLNRAEARAVDSYQENQRQRDDEGNQQRLEIDRPATSTLEGVAGEIGSSAVTEGRDDVAQEAQKQSNATIYAVRTAVLDSNTCDPCRTLDGKRVEVGSRNYNLYAPPSECLGRARCRCYYKIEQGRTQNAPGIALPVPFELDPTEADASGDVEWHQIFPWGEVDHPNGSFDVTREWAQGLVESFQFMESRHGDHPPILRQHQEDGFVWGDIVGVEVRDDGVYAGLDWAPIAQPLRDAEAIDRLSPTFLEQWTDPETGTELGPVLWEVSFVSREHLKSLPTLSESDGASNAPALPDDHTYYALKEAHVPTEDETENAPDEPTENPSDETPDPGPDDGGEGGSSGPQTFGAALEAMLQKASTPEDMPGPGRMDHLETIASNGAPMSAEELNSQLPDILYPSDDLLEAVAEWMSVDPEKLRQGDVKGFGGSNSGSSDGDSSDDASDDDGEGDGSEMPEPTPNDGDPDDEKRRLLESNVRLEAQNEGLDVDDETLEELVELRLHAPKVYETTLHDLASKTDDDPIDQERGRTGGAGGNPIFRQLCQQAKDNGIPRGKELCDYVDEQGYEGDFDPSVARDVYNG